MTKNLTKERARPFLIGHRWQESVTVVPVLKPFAGQVVAEVFQVGKDEAMQESVATFEAIGKVWSLVFPDLRKRETAFFEFAE